MEYRILDLFSGAGGFSYGFDSVDGFETVVATDFNRNALETFKYNFPNTKTIFGDILDKDIKAKIEKKSKELNVNMIIGGPPCQGFSNKGKKLGLKDPRNFLFLEYLDMVNRIRPDVFVIENVKAMLTAANGYFIDEISNRIKNLGYSINKAVMKSSDYGVPQNRERAIIIAYKSGKEPKFPDLAVDKVTVKDAISDLSYLGSGEGSFKQEYRCGPKTEYQKLMRANSKFLYNHQATSHSEQTLYKLSLIPPEKGKEYLPEELHGKQLFNTTWGRLKWNEQSPTIDTRFDTPSNGTNSHPYLNRAITPREAARIQSFPDTFVFIGKKSYITKQIGNAVPPLMARAIAITIRKQSINNNEDI
ncbi:MULTISPECIES: DNA cytosine methyltransferase [Lactobacillaceae]|uniref:DNA cytosine methyltransferase n=1 Tax=Lactobacillaceae TaxID=33958 RepID=UPI00083FBB81|nr:MULTISPECIES: DNA cytosine methyltransferase [Lactobacillaceae]AOG30846.1 DNA (cytosine-5-)-methyltransferase [Lactiplantibacillus plantarum]MDK1742878.1 DNA cytosine methyltransferase [Dellaglioa algida]RAY08362.1 DNA cytosine methyltransferase [Levilactobacillus brevis]